MGASINKHFAETPEEMDLLTTIDKSVDKICKGISANINELNIVTAYRNCFVNKKSIVHYLTPEGLINEAPKEQFNHGLKEMLFGDFIDEYGTMSDIKLKVGDSSDKEKTAQINMFKRIMNEVGNSFINFISIKKQRSKILLKSDMFSDKTVLEFDKYHAIRIAHFTPFKEGNFSEDEEKQYQEIVADYIDHFPEFNELLSFLADCQFSTNRKYAYLWFKMMSDWGKGFFINRFIKLGILVPFKMEEIEKILTGSPSAKDQDVFDNCWIMCCDEFKNAKREVKDLDSGIRLAAKYGFEFYAELRAKLFFSAEGVSSLTEGGVEEQFNNRFGIMSPKKDSIPLNFRAVFKKYGNSLYEKYVEIYIGRELNKYVQKYRDMGFHPAAKKAYEEIEIFHNKYKIDKKYGNQNDEIKLIAIEVKAFIIGGSLDIKGKTRWVNRADMYHKGKNDTEHRTGLLISKREVGNIIDEFLSEHYKHTSGKFHPKQEDIYSLIDESGRDDFNRSGFKCTKDKKDYQTAKRGLFIFTDDKGSKDREKYEEELEKQITPDE